MKGRIDGRENQLKSGMAVLNEDSVYNMIGVERPLFKSFLYMLRWICASVNLTHTPLGMTILVVKC